MTTVHTASIAPTTLVSDEIELWLAASSEPEHATPLIWTSNSARTVAHGVERLSVLASSIPAPAKLRRGHRYSFGMAQWSDHDQRPRWAQTMRLRSGWIVEVSTGSNDSWPLRVYRGASDATYPMHLVGGAPHPSELWSPIAAAEVIWSWQHGCLPTGCQTTLDYLTDEQRQQYGL